MAKVAYMTEDEIKEIRRENVRFLIAERFGGSQKKFADVVLRQESYVSRILNGTKRLGGDLAETFESRLGLARKSLDSPMQKMRVYAAKEPKPPDYTDPRRRRLILAFEAMSDPQIDEMIRAAELTVRTNREIVAALDKKKTDAA
jgi:hypothetical protein